MPLSVLVTDMQPIDPPVGGGRIRLLGLYHGLGIPTTYVGTYDWPGEKIRNIKHSETLTEIDIPLSEAHFKMADEWEKKAGGKNVIDLAFHQMVHLSPDYLNTVKIEAQKADVIVFSHPWLYPAIRDGLRNTGKTVIYDSHNVESYLRYSLLGEEGFCKDLIEEVIRVEMQLCQEAKIVFACSQEDRILFTNLYGIPLSKIKIVPNGVFINNIKPYDKELKLEIRSKLKLPSNIPLAIFMGSSYGPNIEAATFIVNELSAKAPDVHFIIGGGVGDSLKGQLIPDNCTVTGMISEKDKLDWFGVSDIAVNPMFSGSGTNIKMFDFMAAGLAIISTDIGARGIPQPGKQAYITCSATKFSQTLNNLAGNAEKLEELGLSARDYVKEKYSWERISSNLGIIIKRNSENKRPKISVVVASYERHDKLVRLIHKLNSQKFSDFELIIVDQSSEKANFDDLKTKYSLCYIHTSVRGAVKARNTGVFFSKGEIIAFTDDDCEPDNDWLLNAETYFENEEVMGVEGLIFSDHVDDENYRTVSNEGFEGIGFMTANLIVRHDVFNRVDGFDERFDNPHFREDTDLGWRIQKFGIIVFAKNVCVFHPAHKRTIVRESLYERNKFFEKDALLFQKHPKKYIELMHFEIHHIKTRNYWDHLLHGAKKHNVNIIDSELWDLLPDGYKKYIWI